MSNESSGYTYGSGADHVIGEPRVNSALVSGWPNAIDMKDDILKHGRVDTFLRQVKSALRTRALFQYIEEASPTVEDIVAANGGVNDR